MHVEVRQNCIEVCREHADSELDVGDMARKEFDEEVLVDEVCKANERFGLWAVDEDCSCQETHVLNKRQVLRRSYIILTLTYPTSGR